MVFTFVFLYFQYNFGLFLQVQVHLFCIIIWLNFILSQAAWKRSWVGHDPTHSIIVADRSVAITGNMVQAQLLTA